MWKQGLAILATHPWGVGIAAYETAEGLSHGGKGKWSTAHNSFLQIGVELGVLGLICFIVIFKKIISGLKEARSIMERMSTPLGEQITAQSQLALALEISLWGFLVTGFFLSQAYSALLYIVLALSIALIQSVPQFAYKRVR